MKVTQKQYLKRSEKFTELTEAPIVLSKTSIEWPLLLDSINVEHCNTVSVSSYGCSNVAKPS